MQGRIWYLQKEFFFLLNQSTDLNALGIKSYVSVPKNAVMPYVSITMISFSDGQIVDQRQKAFKIELSIFDNSSSIKKISRIIDIVENAIKLDKFNNMEIYFEAISCDGVRFSNDLGRNIMEAKMTYSGILTFLTV